MWDYLYSGTTNDKLKKFMMKIPKSTLNNFNEKQAINYVIDEYHNEQNKINEENVMKDFHLKFAPSENEFKFNTFTDSLYEKKKQIKSDKYSAVINTSFATINTTGKPTKNVVGNIKLNPTPGEIGAKLGLEISNSILENIEGLSKTLQPQINYNSIILPRKNIFLDSRNRNISNINYSWNIIHFNAIQAGEVNARSYIQQILEISCKPFKIPLLVNQNMVYFKHIRMGIIEFNDQGIEISRVDQQSDKYYYHFEFTTEQKGNYLYLYPSNVWKPTKVIAQCDTITVVFFGDTELITLDTDRMMCSYILTGTFTTFTTPSNHNLSTGDLVYIYNGEFYNKQGYIIAVLSPTTFSITVTGESGSVIVFFASKRIEFQLEFICLEN